MQFRKKQQMFAQQLTKENIRKTIELNRLQSADNQQQQEWIQTRLNETDQLEKDYDQRLKQVQGQDEDQTAQIQAKATVQLQKGLQTASNLLKVPQTKQQQKQALQQIKQIIKDPQPVDDAPLMQTVNGINIQHKNMKRIMESIFEHVSDYDYTYYQQLVKKYSKYGPRTFKPQLRANIIIAKNIASSLQQVIGFTNKLKDIILKQLNIISSNPDKWYYWWLKKQGIMRGTPLFNKMDDKLIQRQQINKRIATLQKKQGDISRSFKKFERMLKNRRMKQIGVYTRLMQDKSALYSQQKKTLGFLVLKKEEQIKEIQKQKQDEKNNYDRQYQQLVSKATQIINQKQKAKQQLQNQLKELQNQNQRDEQLITHQKSLIKEQQQQIQQQQKQMQQMQNQLLEQHTSRMNNMDDELTRKNKQKQDLEDEIQRITSQYQEYIKQLQEVMQKNDIQSRKAFSIYQQQASQKIYQVSVDYQNRIKGMEQEFHRFALKGQKTLQQKDRLLAETLQNLRKTQQFSKQKEKNLLDDIERNRNLLESEKRSNKFIVQSQKTNLQALNRKQQQKIKELTQKQKDFLQKKQKQIDQLVIKLAKAQAQLQLKQKQAHQLYASLEKMVNSNSQLSTKLKKYQSVEFYENKYFRWKTGNLQTIRMCFKQKKKTKWIATTRGITYNPSLISQLLQIFSYWQWIYQKKKFPPNKIENLIKGSSILMILDHYKGKQYYSLRQGYWKQGTIVSTRRGFNLSEEQLPLFFTTIKDLSTQQFLD